jgi:photosystem II stability/assembly factor-like uncharacterized protein
MKNLFLFLLVISTICSNAQPISPDQYQDLSYRCIGPFRASRTVGAVGIPSQPNVFFMGVNNGGVWKTDDYGRTWNPIFDDAPTGSVGDIAVFPTQPDIIYVGTGEGLHRPDLSVGDGMFKSINGGQTWNHIGLDDVQQVARVIIHPTNPDIVVVAGLGHPYGANEMRGVFRTTDGGQSWEKVLYINTHTGCAQVEFEPGNPDVIYADMWEHQEGPWENAKFSGPNSGLYKSTDGGNTWTRLEKGLPGAEEGLGRIGVGISPSQPSRLYATVDARENAGVYRSDDSGESWKLIHENRRVFGRGSDFAEIKVHPYNPDVVFSGNVASYKSTDGGYSWTSLKGAPGGDDYHRIWINPNQPDIMIFAADQGATITVNGGKTWSSWYNQPTSQLYHITTDNQFPYWVYGGQQESGAIGIASRGDGGQISFRDFMGIGADEYAYAAPDPKDPDIIYGGRVTRFNKKTGQSQNVGPEALRSGDIRYLRTMPLMFHPADDNMLLFGTNILWQTTDGAQSWQKISPDLTRVQPEVPESVGDFKTPELNTMVQRAIIYALSPSSLDKNIIWAGTDDGLVHVTTDGGKNWTDVTPGDLNSWDKISQIDASHFDKGTAYIAVNAIRKSNMKPLIYKTKDMGKSWTLITEGMNPSGPVNVVREDPKTQGLLFAGTEREIYFSIDEGTSWQSLRMNMPATSVRDLVIHDNDLVAGTHGRSIWIMDDIAPLRALAAAKSRVGLIKPSTATRVRYNMFYDTPLPPEEPTGENPPDGAILDYILDQNVTRVKIEILNKKDQVIRTYASDAVHEKIDTNRLPHPTYWIRPHQEISTMSGHHRVVWDLRHDPPRGAQRGYAISAVKGNTPDGPMGPFVHPGEYKVKLSLGNQVYTHPITVRMDPRVTITNDDLQLQTDLSMECYRAYNQLLEWRNNIDSQLKDTNLSSAMKESLMNFRGNGSPSDGDFLYGSISEGNPEDETIVDLQHKYLFMLNVLQSADVRPTTQMEDGMRRLRERLLVTENRFKNEIK